MDFLTLLRDDLREGLAKTSADYRARHTRWILSQQTPAGAFANRRGKPDLYYTAFALRSLSALNELKPDAARRAAQWLLKIAREPDAMRLRQPHGAFCDTVHAASWWDSIFLCEEASEKIIDDAEREALKTLTFNRLYTMRRDDAGYAKTNIESHGSLYHTFIAASLHARMGIAFPEPEKARAFLRALARPEGGFLENKFSKRPGTNGTAAGVFLSAILGETDGHEKHLDFLASMRNAEGGFEAAPSAPLADLLSTYTALLTLKMGGRLNKNLLENAANYARELDSPDGGYTGFALESVVDCEYTFYGLGVESIAAP
ncbi:MAG TPA: prenyltransferase/squalene oxidase repeat-containing protein [Planctomycetota bacterium]|nr:prenyltransferase/squalene oxidase repeat-containing protein [Planctomycetota bacterium]